MVEKNYGTSTILTTIAFAITFIAIGLPLWWKTTEVYRYPIPHTECQQLLSQKVIHKIMVKLILADNNIQQGILWEELLYLSQNNYDNEDLLKPIINFDWTMESANEMYLQKIHLSKSILDLENSLLSDEKMENRLNNHSPLYKKLEIIILHKNFSKDSKYTLGRDRKGYILNDADSKSLAKDVMFLAKKLAQVERLKKLYTPPSRSTISKKPDKDRLRYLRYSSSFDINFSLMVSEPQIFEVQWDIEKALNNYLNPILEELTLISKVEIKSQILYMTSLSLSSSMRKENVFTIDSEDLPSIINSIETRLGSDASIDPNLNFIIYVPTREQTPLQIYDSNGLAVPTNAFLLPQWGGFLIYNPPKLLENSSLPIKVKLNTKNIFEIFLSQFRLLLGLPELIDIENERCSVLPNPGIRKWELDFLLRKNAQEQLSLAISSLSSLSHLLQKIGNIVIRDDVGQKIYFALSSTKQSIQTLQKGFLEQGFIEAKSAFLTSEEAFFDPSLLALLYFPDDQKYAIYIPLFLPISIPVIASLFYVWKFWWDRKHKKIKTD